MFEVIHGHDDLQGDYSIVDKTSITGADSAMHLAPQFIHAGWEITFADDELVVAEFGARWIQISRKLTV